MLQFFANSTKMANRFYLGALGIAIAALLFIVVLHQGKGEYSGALRALQGGDAAKPDDSSVGAEQRSSLSMPARAPVAPGRQPATLDTSLPVASEPASWPYTESVVNKGVLLSEYYGLPLREIETLLEEQSGPAGLRALRKDVSGLQKLEVVQETLVAELTKKAEAVECPPVETVALRLLGAQGGDLQTAMANRLGSGSGMPLIEENVALAISHGLASMGQLRAAEQHVFATCKGIVMRKIAVGEVDIFPLVNINALMPYRSFSGERLFHAHHSYEGWQAAVACHSGEYPEVQNAIRARDEAFEAWWGEVASLAGAEGD